LGSGGIAPPFFTSALDGELSASRPGRFTHREIGPGTHWMGGWVGPRADLDTVKRNICPAGNRTRVVQPVAIPTELSRLLYIMVKLNNW
jgi:hypothetical protein